MRGSLLKSAVVIAGLIAIATIILWPSDRSQPMDRSHRAEPVVLNRPIVTPASGYVGAAACQDCHQEQFTSWHASYHRTMTQVISEQTAPQVIWDNTVEVEGRSYQFEREQGDFFVRLSDPIVGGELRRRQMVMMTGSHHMHVFWYESDFRRTPAQLPIVYLKDQARWVPRRSVLLQPPDEPVTTELGYWNQTCCRCHSTHPRQRLDAETTIWDTQVGDFGIACEACHGPGEGHIAFHQELTKSNADDLVVNPNDLSHDAKSDLCGQCHSVHILDFDTLSEEQFFAHGATFRPGTKLSEDPLCRLVRGGPDHWQSDAFRTLAKSERKLNGTFWPDGESRVSGSDYSGMIESPCFERGELSCMSCHQLHEQKSARRDEWRDDQLKKGMRGDGACLQCHADYAELGSAHTHHAVGSSGNQCMNCHMPHTVYGLLKTIRSHRISSPSARTTIQTGRPNACNLCHLDKTLQWAGDHLAQWYGQEKPKFTKDEKEMSAAVLHLVKGDAAQRAIQASALAGNRRVKCREPSGCHHSYWSE